MWQMELQTFVFYYLSCYFEFRASAQAYFQSDSGMFGRICAAVSVRPEVFTRLRSTFACLLSLQRRAGMRGMQASGLPVYSEGFLHCSPCSFLCRIFHIFVLAVVLGTGRGLGTREPLVAFLTLCLVEFFPTAHNRLFPTHLRYFYSRKLNSTTVCHHFILLHWAETW